MKKDRSKYYFFDIKTLKERLSDSGFAIYYNNVSENYFKEYIKSLGHIYIHKNSDVEGFSIISDLKIKTKGLKGYTNDELQLHTDRSCLKNTPSFIAIYFKETSKKGGESNFVDVKKVVNFLKKEDPSLLELLLTEKCLFFDKEYKFESPIVNIIKNDIFIRYRNDDFINIPEKLKEVIPLWEKYLLQHQFTYKFKKGEFYILNNTTMLHGRNKFEGKRTVIRTFFYDNDF